MRATFFALAALPFYAIAQDPVPEAVPTTTTTSEAFIPPVINTSTDLPVELPPTTTDAIVVPQSTSDAIPENPETTTQLPPVVQDTTTSQDIVQGTTSQAPPPAQDSTTGPAPVIDTTQPIEQQPTTQPTVQDTTTGQPIIEDTTSQGLPVQDSTTELPPPVVPTSTWLPIVDTTNQPIIQTPGSSQETVGQDTTTEVQVPIVPTTTSDAVPGTTTETNNPLPDTTTEQQPPIENTTTGIPSADTTTAQEPVQDTTTTVAEQPAQTTTQQEEPKPTTDESKPTSNGEPVITQPPAQTTVAPEVATSSVSSVSSQVAALIPVINKWTEDPESLTDETNKQVEDTHDDIIAVIVSLGGKPDVGCNKKRGLLGPIGDIINKLACMAQDLTNISGNIIAGNVPAVTGAVPGVQSQNDDLTDKEEENQSDEEQSKEESTKQEESTKEESTTEPPTTTDAPTSTEESTTTAEATTTTTGLPPPCGSDTCGGGGSGSCPIAPGGSKGGQMGNAAGDINCNDISSTTIDGPLPTDPSKPITFGDDPFTAPTARSESAAPPSKRDIELVGRAFNDDMSPNPFYVASLTPIWVDQTGATAGHWFGAPPFAGKGSAGVNGIYGCTSVIIVSDLGVYLSHIWENPVFVDNFGNPTPDDEFDTTTFNAFRDGTVNALSVVGLVGTDEAPGVLHSIYHPRVFVVTPFTNDLERSFGVTTTFRYEERANRLATQVSGIVPGSDSTVLGYTRTNREESTEQYGTWGRAIVEYDMLEEIVFGTEENALGQFMGRWRLWVEDQLVTSHKFIVYPDLIDLPQTTPVPTPIAGLQKRAEEEAASKCLVRGGSTGTTSAGPSSTDKPAATTDTTSTAETSAGPTTDDKTVEATGTTTADETTAEAAGSTTSEDKTAEATTTQSDTVLPTSTPSTLITTTRASSNAITSGVTTDAATTSEDVRTYYPCVVYGGPRVDKPYCQCSTTVSGKQYVTSASLIDNSCEDYTSYPSPVIPVTDAPATQAPVQTPFTETNDGTVLVYSAYTLEYFMAYTVHVTATRGYGVPSTVSTPLPSQTAVDNDGSGQCGTSDSLSKQGLGEACDRAINEFDADTVYKGYTTRYSRSNKGILMVASVGQAACIAKFECDDYGIGMKGSDIIAARENAKKNDGIWICGHIRLSNSCSVVMDYCTNCDNRG
ncbi:hypothetical protein FBEOM_12869 [Fusarium beomiforme]|uniref:Uncharacterized protein n=1 Tax=Fusarium beomiforme TaxID=44412 RepID=A0A9P5A6R7_9HYPO|nr:hypothetical protein FBEOM_12869 [Fusarium beomiforme]